jgi:transposase
VKKGESALAPKQLQSMQTQRNNLTLFYLLEFEQNVRNTVSLYIQNIQPGVKTQERFSLFSYSVHKIIDMKKIVKQAVGIDVAQKELVVCLGRMYDDWTPELYSSKAFANTKKGFDTLITWVKKQTDKTVDIRYVMEATGVYHESLAYFLDEKGHGVSIVLPNKISNYMRTLDVKTVTDKTASEAIAKFGLERKLDRWKKPKEIYRSMKQLTRERDQIVEERSVVKNHLHAEESEAFPNKSSLARINERIKVLNKQEKAIKAEVAKLIAKDNEVKTIVDKVVSIPGIGQLTAAIILAETNGFELIRNKRQLASYAGFDVKEKQSGTSVKGKPRISKKGNRHLRKAMHLPALVAIRHDNRYKAIYARTVAKHGIKMKAVVAVQRRLLEMTYTVYKTNTAYNKNHLQKNEENEQNNED